MQINLKIWRQTSPDIDGTFEEYKVDNVLEDMSFFEMLDMLNNQLIKKEKEPISFDHDCREGICGTCGVVINGRAHGPLTGITTCQLHMRSFKDGDTLVVETKNFLRETSFMRGGASAALEVTERFTRVSADGLQYSVTVNDPLTWMQPWTYEVPMVANPDPIYEYACHEGNYSMAVILAGAREKEASERAR